MEYLKYLAIDIVGTITAVIIIIVAHDFWDKIESNKIKRKRK